jgi:hypothetical protein
MLGDVVVHVPTGAYWTANSKCPQLAALYMGKLGSVLENGDEYDRRDVHDVAMTILERRLSSH